MEFKVGLFVMAALVLLFGLVLKAGDFHVKPGYTVHFIFKFVSGIDIGSPVRLAGVNVGEVKSIQVVRDAEGNTQVELRAWIDQSAYIEEDAEVRINSLGFLGEKYVEILPGTSGSKTLAEGGRLIGQNPVVFEKITESGSRLLSKVELTVDSLNNVVTEKKFQDSVKNTFGRAESTFANADQVMTDLKEATADLKDAAKSVRIVMARLRDGEGTVGRLLTDDTMAKDLEAFVKDIKAHPWKLLKRG